MIHHEETLKCFAGECESEANEMELVKELDNLDRRFGYPPLPKELAEVNRRVDKLILQYIDTHDLKEPFEIYVPMDVWKLIEAYTSVAYRWDRIVGNRIPTMLELYGRKDIFFWLLGLLR